MLTLPFRHPRTVLSDGVDEISGLFASSLTAPLREAELGTEQIITVTKYRVQIMNNQKPVLFVQEVKPEIIACTVFIRFVLFLLYYSDITFFLCRTTSPFTLILSFITTSLTVEIFPLIFITFL